MTPRRLAFKAARRVPRPVEPIGQRGLLVSIVICNHNYERFLGAAIDSALGHTYPSC